MKIKQYDLVIFDWDGTLMDSIGKIITCIENMARTLQLPIPSESDIRDIIGLSMTEALRVLFPQGLNLSASSVYSQPQHPKNAFGQGEDDQYQQMRAEFKAQYLHLDATPTPLFAQAPLLIDQLHTQGYQLAVATGKARAGLDRVFEQTGLGRYFVASRCADEVHSKPHPEMISSLLKELNIAPNRALMVGDSLLDLTMAANAGIDSVGVTYGAHRAEKLLRAKPIALIDSPAQLLQYL
ncbi:MAG: HAD-IA family hydrolase [Gammaproteobacteria bacterium]|nr:HAD-IA family hydrolase [Gammaproteobacteria bacterium]MBU1479892.1 HAD-IA family hydrolase [Gammaproteobacteria bacterium]MBU1999696.1 HAD-IA family hydrolase [Gammaproteobacteria bacterium]MBU2133526.1 HAD-IA family hydrolase [Gammaproteobacteria bacterium]MBU2185954.1 HAD-IA family hydrolase [Gammaproteobacteria bacterium]